MVQVSPCRILPKTKKLILNRKVKKRVVGFLSAKLGVLFGLQTGAAIAVIIEVFKTHDVKLARQLSDDLNPGDIFLSDRACCSYADIYFIKQRNCDMEVNPLRLSLQETRHHLAHFVNELKNSGVRKGKKIYQTMLEAIAHKPIKKRPLRFEPRVKKRRPKAYPLMSLPRSVLRQKVA